MSCGRFFPKVCLAFYLTLAACLSAENHGRLKTPGSLAELPQQTSCPQQLTAQGEAELLGYVDTARLNDLLWPNFEDYRSETKEFYNSFCNSLPWIQGTKPTRQARELIRELLAAADKGLKPEDYDGPLWDERLAAFKSPNSASESALIRFDVALTVSTMRYLSDLRIGRVNPRALHFEFEIYDKRLDLSDYLKYVIVNAQDVSAAVEGVEPLFPVYRRTLHALQHYLELARRDDGEVLPSPRHVIQPGNSYSGVPRLVRLLTLLGDFPSADAKAPRRMIYEGRLVDAVKHFQQRHGLYPTGLIDSPTLAELNTPLSRRVLQLQLTLERWRWLPQNLGSPIIVVNIPEFRLHVVSEEHRVVFSMSVVVGKAFHHPTPVFAGEITAVVFRPFWNVPPKIQHDEFVPELEKNPLYLVENSFEIVDARGDVVEGDPITEDIVQQLRSGQLGLRQKPGPANSLGLIKFEMPNPYDIYLHATPASELFSKSRRDFSHGCIRLEDPVALAAWVLRNQSEWTTDRIRAAMDGEEILRVNLDKPVTVLVLYGTAAVKEDGQVFFFRDIYSLDEELEKALTNGKSPSK
jgi:murein L,D-transpeptidase YcbB/YkuD